MAADEICKLGANDVEDDLALVTLIFVDLGSLGTEVLENIPDGFGRGVRDVIELLLAQGRRILTGKRMGIGSLRGRARLALLRRSSLLDNTINDNLYRILRVIELLLFIIGDELVIQIVNTATILFGGFLGGIHDRGACEMPLFHYTYSILIAMGIKR